MKLITPNDPYTIIAEMIDADPQRYGQGGTNRRQLEAQLDRLGVDRDYDRMDEGMGPGDLISN